MQYKWESQIGSGGHISVGLQERALMGRILLCTGKMHVYSAKWGWQVWKWLTLPSYVYGTKTPHLHVILPLSQGHNPRVLSCL